MGSLFRRIVDGPWLPSYVGKAPYLWLASLVFFLLKYFFVKVSVVELVLAGVSVVVFLPLYFISFWPGRRNLIALVAVCALGLAWVPFNLGGFTFLVFAAGMCAGITPPRRAYMTLAAVLLLAACMLVVFDRSPFVYRLAAVVMAVPVGVASIMDANLRRSREQLLRKQEEVEHIATIAERERISRDLHDLLGHTLSLIAIKAELAGKLIGRNDEACRQEIGDIERSARTALAEVRAAVTGYRQTGLAHEIATARASLAAAGVAMHTELAALSIPAALESVLALALREAVTNIVRHARATRCSVRLMQDERSLILRIDDDGEQGGPVVAGNGLTGMRERVQALGGRLGVRRDKGMMLELTLPLEAHA